MTKKQRIGLVLLMCTLIMVTLFGSKPDLTFKVWLEGNIISGIISGIAGAMFIFK
jgi:hypothetical protein